MEEEVRGRVRQRRSQATGLGQEKANQGAVLHLSTKSFSQVVNGWAAGGPLPPHPAPPLSLSRSRALSSCPSPVTLLLA